MYIVTIIHPGAGTTFTYNFEQKHSAFAAIALARSNQHDPDMRVKLRREPRW